MNAIIVAIASGVAAALLVAAGASLYLLGVERGHRDALDAKAGEP